MSEAELRALRNIIYDLAGRVAALEEALAEHLDGGWSEDEYYRPIVDVHLPPMPEDVKP